MKNDDAEFEKIKLIVDNLNQEINSYTPWVSRKEIAAWSAIAVFVAIMFSIIKYILTTDIAKLSKYFEILTAYVIFSVLVIVFSVIIFLFIHSQYSSIYDKRVYTIAIQKVIFRLILKGTETKENFKNVKALIDKKYNKIRDEIRKPGENHIKRIFLNLFARDKKKKLSTHEIQEALLYITIFFFDFVFLGSVIFSLLFRFAR